MTTDPRSSFMETTSSRKESSFLDKMPLIKLVGVANRQSPTIQNLWLCTTGTPRLGCVQRVFLSVVETIVGWALCCSVGIVSVFSIFCVTLLGDCTPIRHTKKQLQYNCLPHKLCKSLLQKPVKQLPNRV